MEIVKSKWNNQSVIHLSGACDNDYTINDLCEDVQSGMNDLFNVYENGQHVASMVLRLEDHRGGRELVVVALGGETIGKSTIQKLVGYWDKLAVNNKARKIRAHVSKDGMARLMERAGGVLSERVYKREVFSNGG